jgi:hypothetical protein
MNTFEFADVIDKVIEVQRYPNQKGRWTAQFLACEISVDGRFLFSAYGEGTTPQEAIMSYVRAIRGNRLIFNATSKLMRQEFTAPEVFA